MTPLEPEAVARFKAWALRRYTARTTSKLLGDLATMIAHDGEPPDSQRRAARLRDYRWTWDVWGDAREEAKLPELPLPRPVPPAAVQRGGRRAREPKRLREATAMPSEGYRAFLDAIAKDDRPAARVVEIMARTGLRVADVLRVKLDALRTALAAGEKGTLPILVKGEKPALVEVRPALDAWRRAYASAWQGAETLADAVTGRSGSDPEAQGAAYERCRRTMKRHGLAAGVDGRLHLHRLRRTVGAELLNQGASLEEVQQVLIHDSIKTTEQWYTDEYRAKAAGNALDRLNRRKP
jgi:integrase